MTDKITIRVPDDMHVHFREGDMLRKVVPCTSSVFGRALVMPNTAHPMLGGADVCAYAEEINLAANRLNPSVPEGCPPFRPLTTVKLLRSSTPDVLHDAAAGGAVAAKFYPEGVTTNSHDGVADLRELAVSLAALERLDMVLCLHGEVPGAFCMDREALFLDSLRWAASSFPNLRIVLEHVTTAAAVREVRALRPGVAATITAHHLFHTLDDVVGGMLNPHAFCKPIAKTRDDRAALRSAAVSGDPKFFFGSDTAPHLRGKKECASGCAGVFSAPCAIESLATAFDECGALDRLEDFVSHFGADFYAVPRNPGTITLAREDWRVPDEVHGVVPFMAGKSLPWRVTSDRHMSFVASRPTVESGHV